MDELVLLQEMLEIYSPSGKEGEIAAYLVTQMRSLGFCAYQDAAGNAIGVLGEGEKEIMLLGHMDTVEGFIPIRLEDGRLYGRGAVDAKGPLATFILAAARVGPLPDKRIVVVGAVEEEAHSKGARYLLNSFTPQMAIIGEPTSMQLVNAHKGIFAFETVLSGLEAHSSATHIGVSAVLHGAEFITFLASLAEEMREQGPFGDAFDPPYTTFNIGQVNGGTAVNIIPRECRIIWEFRPIPGLDLAALKARIEGFTEDQLLPRMRERFPGAGVRTTEFAGAPPLVPREGSAAEALVRRLTGANRAGTVSFATEAGQFAEKDMSAVVIGPGSIDQAHKPDEYVDLEQLAACEEFLKKLIAWAAETAPE